MFDQYVLAYLPETAGGMPMRARSLRRQNPVLFPSHAPFPRKQRGGIPPSPLIRGSVPAAGAAGRRRLAAGWAADAAAGRGWAADAARINTPEKHREVWTRPAGSYYHETSQELHNCFRTVLSVWCN